MEAFEGKIEGISAPEILNLVLMMQYFDTLKDIGVSPGSKVILTPHAPGGMGDLMTQLREAVGGKR